MEESILVIRWVMMVCLVMAMLVGSSRASFGSCYAGCFVGCLIKSPHYPPLCAVKCVKTCMKPSSSNLSDNEHTQNYFFCKLGCASSLCSNFSSKDNAGVEKVEGCVDSCSQTCLTN